MTLSTVVVFDLDDTLYLERDYIVSGFTAVGRIVERRWGRAGFAAAALRLFEVGARGHVFDEVLLQMRLPANRATVDGLVAIYREHRPAITLLPEAERLIRKLRRTSRTAMISDGPLAAQERKVEALALCAFFDPVVLTDAWGREFWKPHERAFRAVEAAMGCAGRACTYVADNPIKDFVAPRRLGWRTIRVRHPQAEHAGIEAPGVADAECESLDEVARLIAAPS